MNTVTLSKHNGMNALTYTGKQINNKTQNSTRSQAELITV